MPSSRGVTRWSKVRASATPNTAIASRPATRATALLTPDADPAWRASTASITVAVSGAPGLAIPKPSDDGEKKLCPVRPADAGPRAQRKAARGNDGTDRQRKPAADPRDQA